jgi:hypothetical protein
MMKGNEREMTKQQARGHRDQAVEAVKEAQAACGKAISPLEHQRAKNWLAGGTHRGESGTTQSELGGDGCRTARPPATESPRRKLTIQELSTVLLESFQQLLILDASHPAIATLRQHFLAQVKEAPPAAALRPSEPLPLHSAGRPFLDSVRRQSSGPGAQVYSKAARTTRG